MRASREPVASHRDEDLIDLFSRRLPDLLGTPAGSGADALSCIPEDLRAARRSRNLGTKQIDTLVNLLESGRFDQMERSIDRLGLRWGIRNESLFRRPMAELLEQCIGVGVEQRIIAGEQFDGRDP